MQPDTETPGIGHNGGPPLFDWRFLPGSSQALALGCDCHHILYTGTRGPGKTDTQLMHFIKNVGKGYGRFWRGIIFDREYKMLDDIVNKSKRWFPLKNDGARFLESKSDYKWVWPTGEELLFRSISKLEDYWNYHGQEFPWIGWNELCKYPTLELYDRMMSCNRSSFIAAKDAPIYQDGTRMEVPEIPLQVFATTNSYGPGHNAVKRRFITPAAFGQILNRETEVFNPRTQRDETVTKRQVSILGTYRENIYLSAEYVAELVNISDPNLRAAWEMGSWDIVSGGALDDLWDRNIHVIDRFPLPPNWRVNRCLDWGSTHPYAYGLFAEANGETIEFDDGRKWTPAANSIIMCGELYGTKEIGTNKGVKQSAGDLGKTIAEYEKLMIRNGWINSGIMAGPADNQIRDVRESDVETIETKLRKAGVYFAESDKSRGSRKIGLQLFRDRLEASKRREGPGIYFMRNCRASIETIPIIPRDPDNLDDVDTTSEDHCYDMVRYRCLSGAFQGVGHIKQTFVS